MRTTARLEDGEWVIDGTKAFITNSGTAITSLVTVLAITGRGEDGREGDLVDHRAERDGGIQSPAVLQGRLVRLGHPRAVLRRLPGPGGEPARRAGPRLRPVPADPDEGRVAIAALATGLAQGCVDECVRYAGQREAFGRPIGEHQAIQFTIADMEVRAHAARLAWYDAAARLVAGQPFKKEAAIAKLNASNAAVDNARAATQVFGGYGFMNEYPVARF